MPARLQDHGTRVSVLVADGVLAGLSLDKVIVQLPARRRIGITAYAAYARAADMGNGIAFYAAVGVGGALLTIAAFVVAGCATTGVPPAVWVVTGGAVVVASWPAWS
jgi:hypothetical protein